MTRPISIASQSLETWLDEFMAEQRSELLLGCVTLTFAITLLVFTILAWLNPELSFVEQISYSIIAIASLGFIPFLNYWNLLGFR